MKRTSIFSIVALLGMVCVTSLSPSHAAAAPVESITLSPTDFKLMVDRGEQVNRSLTLINDGDTAYDVVVYAAPYSIDKSSSHYAPLYESSTSENADANKWVQLQQSRWHLEAHQSVTVPFVLRVPATTAPGGHYGVIFAEVQPSADAGNLARKKRVGSVLYITVKGDLHLSGSVASHSIPWFQQTAPMTSAVTVQNTGNSDFSTQMSMVVSDVFGNIKYQSSNEYQVLPDTSRQMALEWREAPWIGVFKVKTVVTYTDKNEEFSSYVIMAPLWFVFLLGAAILYVTVDITRRRQKGSRKHAGKAPKG